MVVSVGKNSSDFIKKHPPMVIFLACLIVLVFSLITLTFYIKYAEDLVDTDAKQNWLSISKYLSGSRACPQPKLQPELKEEDFVSISTFLDVNISGISHLRGVEVIAYYNLNGDYKTIWVTIDNLFQGWKGGCPINIPHNSTMIVQFMVDENDESKFRQCALVRGPKQIMPRLSHSLCSYNNKRYVNYRSLNVTNDISAKSCDKGSINVKLISDSYIVYLSEKDRSTIYVHLLWSTYLLLFVILLMVFVIMFKAHDDKRESLVYS